MIFFLFHSIQIHKLKLLLLDALAPGIETSIATIKKCVESAITANDVATYRS